MCSYKPNLGTGSQRGLLSSASCQSWRTSQTQENMLCFPLRAAPGDPHPAPQLPETGEFPEGRTCYAQPWESQEKQGTSVMLSAA